MKNEIKLVYFKDEEEKEQLEEKAEELKEEILSIIKNYDEEI